MTDKEVLKLALGALEYHTSQTRPIYQTDIAIAALKERLAQPEQEPAAWISPKGNIHFDPYLDSVPLYTHPPQRTEQEPVGEVSGHDWSTGLLYRDLEPGTSLYTLPPQRTEGEHMSIDFNQIKEVHKAANKIGVGYSLNYRESDDSWFFTIDSVSPDEYWCGKNHSFDIAVICVLEQLALFDIHNKENT